MIDWLLPSLPYLAGGSSAAFFVARIFYPGLSTLLGLAGKLLIVVAVFFAGAAWNDRRVDLREAKAEIERLNKIVSNTAAVAEADRKKAEEAAQRSSELETIIEGLSAHAKTLNGACLSAPDAERLRGLWK